LKLKKPLEIVIAKVLARESAGGKPVAICRMEAIGSIQEIASLHSQ